MATEKAITPKAADSQGWQVVRRRRPYPANWRLPNTTTPITRPYQPFPRPTYAQVLRNPPTTNKQQSAVTPPNSQPNSPISSSPTVFYVSPNSPSRLRFPLSHIFPEWKGRCFRCCRTGHSAAKCRNPKRCGRCWAYGYIGSKCKQDVVAPPPPINTAMPLKPITKGEPDFEELLHGSYPYRPPEMSSERPIHLHCFIE